MMQQMKVNRFFARGSDFSLYVTDTGDTVSVFYLVMQISPETQGFLKNRKLSLGGVFVG